MSRVVDTLLPVFVGHRTQIVAGLMISNEAVQSIGLIGPATADTIRNWLAGPALLVFAAKVDRALRTTQLQSVGTTS